MWFVRLCVIGYDFLNVWYVEFYVAWILRTLLWLFVDMIFSYLLWGCRFGGYLSGVLCLDRSV